MIKILHLYLITSFLLPVILLPSKTTNNVDPVPDPECLKCCVSNCGDETKSSRYTWSFCASVSLFLAPVIEYTFIFLEQRDLLNDSTSLSVSGTLEGFAGLTGVSCMEQDIKIVSNCEKECEEACKHGTLHQNKTGQTLDELISILDKEQQKFEDFTLMTKLQYSGKLTTSRRVQIEEQAFRDIWQHAEEIVGWFSYRDSNGKPSANFMFEKKLKQLRHDGGINWILWSINQMVREFINLDRQFCALWPDWFRIQLRLMEAQAYTVAGSSEAFLGIEDHLSPLKYSRNRFNEQIIFTKKKCLKPSIVKKDLGLKDFW